MHNTILLFLNIAILNNMKFKMGRARLAFSLTFSKEEGDTTEKQTRKTSVWG